MKQYKQLTSGQRYQIYGLKQAGLNQTRIAQKMGVDKSKISREFRRNKVNAAGGQNRRNRYVMSASKPVRMASASHGMNGRKSRG